VTVSPICNQLALVFDTGDEIRYDEDIGSILSIRFSQKGGAYMTKLNSLSRLQGSAARDCLDTPPLTHV